MCVVCVSVFCVCCVCVCALVCQISQVELIMICCRHAEGLHLVDICIDAAYRFYKTKCEEESLKGKEGLRL